MGGVQSFGDLLYRCNLFKQGHLGSGPLQRPALDELHGDVGVARSIVMTWELADFVYLADVRLKTENPSDSATL